MDVALAAVAETLAFEFGVLRSGIVGDVVSDCVDEGVYNGAELIEQAAREQLRLLGSPGKPPVVTEARDALDVTLHDPELAEEVELTARLIIAVNESERRLAQHEVDDILAS